MQFRYLKDLAIALLFIALLAYGIRLVSYNSKAAKVPDKHNPETVSATLREDIVSIEESISERKNTLFTVARDPLRQGNIIKDKFDKEKEMEDAIFNTFRPMGITRDEETGEQLVKVEFRGETFFAGVGGEIAGRRIAWINEQNVGVYYGGLTQTLSYQPVPVMPDFSQEELIEQNTDQNY